MRVVGFTRPSRTAHAPEHYAELTPDFERAVGEADFISLHIAATPENARLIDAGRLSLMPARAWLINTARGAVVDESALFDALHSRRIAGAARSSGAID